MATPWLEKPDTTKWPERMERILLRFNVFHSGTGIAYELSVMLSHTRHDLSPALSPGVAGLPAPNTKEFSGGGKLRIM